jgi:hypothetical protein
MEDCGVRLRLCALKEWLLQRDCDFAFLQDELSWQSQAEESTAAALTDAMVPPSRIEAQFGRRLHWFPFRRRRQFPAL